MDTTQFNEMLKEVEDLQARMKEQAKELVTEGAKAIFEEYGDILWGFGWIQYTPYFNDGDPCTFGMHDLSLFAREDLVDAPDPSEDQYEFDSWLNEQDAWYGGTESFGYRGKAFETVGWGKDEKPNPAVDPRYVAVREACEGIYKVLSTNDISKELFGDHVKILITEKGVEVEEYDHD